MSNESTIVKIIKSILPEVETVVIDELKPKAIEWLSAKIEDVKSNVAKEKICVLHASFGHGLWKDEGKLAVYEAELAILTWALNEVNTFVLDQPVS